jgi:hypothetical protein
MTLSGDFSRYPETVELVQKIRTERATTLNELPTYFSRIKSKLEAFSEPRTPEAGRRRSSQIQFSDAQQFYNPAFASSLTNFDTLLIRTLTSFTGDYNSRIDAIASQLKSALDTLTSSRSVAEKANAAYATAGEELKVAFDSQSPNLKTCRSAFVKAQQYALEMHTRMNDVAADSSMQIETGLSQFEDLERFWSRGLADIMGKVADWLEDLAQDLDKAVVLSHQMMGVIPEPQSIEKALNLADLLEPATDDKFQGIQLDRKLFQILDMQILYQAEIAKGLLLYRAVRDCPGSRGNLPVAAGELVVGLKAKGDMIVAKNLNESVGDVPVAALEAVSPKTSP